MEIVIRPVKKPPILKENDCLSQEAKETIKALEEKYSAYKSMLSINRPRNDPADYYKRIYEKTFKSELLSQSAVRSCGQSTSSRNQNSQWQATHFKKYTLQKSKQSSFCLEDTFEETDSRPNFCSKSPLIELGDTNDFRAPSFSDHHNHPKQTYSTNVEPHFMSHYKIQTTDLAFQSQKADSSKDLLMKWNRKFSQMASQVKNKQANTMKGKEDIDEELMWINDMHSQEDKSGPGSEWKRSTTSPSVLHIFEDQKVTNASSPNDPFTVFSLVEKDYVQDFDIGSGLDKNEQKVLKSPNIPINLPDKSHVTEYVICEEHPQSEQPIESPQTTAAVSSPKINEEEQPFEIDIISQSEISNGSLPMECLPIVDDSNITHNENDEMERKNVQVQAAGMLIRTESFKEKRKRKAANTNNKSIKAKIPTDVKEDPLFNLKPKVDIQRKDRKNDNVNMSQNMIKRFKPGFKPPTKDQIESCNNIDQNNKPKTYNTTQSLKDTQARLPIVIDYFSLTSEKKHSVVEEINSTQHISLTIVIASGKSLVNVFDDGVNCTKDPTVILLTAEHNCYQLTINSDTVQDVKNILFQILSSERCDTIIPNSKKFLSSLYKMLCVDANDMINCERLEDPVLASWLLNPDKPPTSFSMICQTAHLKFTETENDWLTCFKFTKKLMNSLKKRLEGDNLLKLYTDIEMKLAPVLACMENQSLKVDIARFRKYADILKTKLHKLEESAYKEVGHKFTINSHPQLRQILYEELKLDEKLPLTTKIGKTSVANHKSTCESSLLLLTGLHPLPAIILEYRSLKKLKSTYIDGMLSCMSGNLISTHWDQTSAATGRITSYQPNIQNIPKTVVVVEDYLPNTILGSAPKSSANIYAREPFICHDGFVFLAADFQQIELRILAHLSDDKALLSMFWNPDCVDIFSLLTAEWKNMDVDKVTIEDRETTKRIVYSVMYGVGKEKLAVYLKVKPDIAKEIMKNFLARFPAIDSFTKKCCSYAKEYGLTETICGRRRYFPYINSSSPALRAQAQRQAVNFCVQGSAADICKLAMLEVESSLKKHPHLNYRLLVQIHDELLWEVQEDQVLEAKGLIESVMENAKKLCQKFCSLQVPLSVSFSQGQSWAHLTPFNSTVKSNES